MRQGDLVLDIASNDGCALKEFLPYGVRPLGVDPAENLAAIATADGIPTLAKFWSPAVADEIVQKHGKARIITAMNVFAHVHDVHSFVEGVKRALADDGTFIIEVPYLVDLLNNNIFDTIYHEHLSYYLVSPLVRLFEAHGLHLNNVERIDIHGGTVRLFVQKNAAPNAALERLLRQEKNEGYLSFEKYREFARHSEKIRAELTAMVQQLRSQGKTIAGFGASAKGCIMLNYCGMDSSHVSYIVDDTPEKQGRFMAGCRIPIVPRSVLETQKPDYLLVLAWNFLPEVQAKTAAFRTASFGIPCLRSGFLFCQNGRNI
jgi:SAM-dependent methyltransferase